MKRRLFATISSSISGRPRWAAAGASRWAAKAGEPTGGGVQGGQAYGKTDPEGREVIENKVLVPDLNATIAYALGLPTDKVLHSPSGRPFQIAHKGKPVTSIF